MIQEIKQLYIAAYDMTFKPFPEYIRMYLNDINKLSLVGKILIIPFSLFFYIMVYIMIILIIYLFITLCVLWVIITTFIKFLLIKKEFRNDRDTYNPYNN